jgi:hypothetical protein
MNVGSSIQISAVWQMLLRVGNFMMVVEFAVFLFAGYAIAIGETKEFKNAWSIARRMMKTV